MPECPADLAFIHTGFKQLDAESVTEHVRVCAFHTWLGEELLKIKNANPKYFFTRGEAKPSGALSTFHKRYRKVFKLAGEANGNVVSPFVTLAPRGGSPLAAAAEPKAAEPSAAELRVDVAVHLLSLCTLFSRAVLDTLPDEPGHGDPPTDLRARSHTPAR